LQIYPKGEGFQISLEVSPSHKASGAVNQKTEGNAQVIIKWLCLKQIQT